MHTKKVKGLVKVHLSPRGGAGEGGGGALLNNLGTEPSLLKQKLLSLKLKHMYMYIHMYNKKIYVYFLFFEIKQCKYMTDVVFYPKSLEIIKSSNDNKYRNNTKISFM